MQWIVRGLLLAQALWIQEGWYYTLTYNASDAAGNAATAVTRTVTVSKDKTPPVITLKGESPITLEAGNSFTDPGAKVTDAVDSERTITGTGTVDSKKVGEYTLTYNASDAAGNAATAVTRTVTVSKDTTPPVITLKGESPITLEAGNSFTDPGAKVTDAVDSERTITGTGTVDPKKVGTYTLTYNASDAAGNAATAVTRTVTVSKDKTPPVITLKGESPITLEAGNSFTDPGAKVTDAVDSERTITGTGTVDPKKVGTYTLTYNASDAAGNAATAVTRTVTVSKDKTPPVITLKGESPITLEAGNSFTDPGAKVTDAVDSERTITGTGTVDPKKVGTYTLTYNASDAAGNAATAVTRTVTVSKDTTPPVITLKGESPITLEAGNSFTDPGAKVTDAVDSERTITGTGTVDPKKVGEYTLTYNASDAAGNAATAVTRTVTVSKDKTPPVITLKGESPITLEAGNSFTDPGAKVTDAVDSERTITGTGTVDSKKVGEYTLTYNASDAAGNAATAVTRTVTVSKDTTPPVITLKGESPITLEAGNSFTDPGAKVTDAVDSERTITGTGTVDPKKVGTYTLTYNASDAAGNAATAVTRTVTVSKDKTPPVITLKGESPITLEAGNSFTDPGAKVTDAVDSERTITGTGTVDPKKVGTYTLTYNASDAAGNAATAVTRTVTVSKDTKPPVITLSGNAAITLEVGDSFTDLGATATDAVDGNLTSRIVVTGTVDSNKAGTYTLTYKVSDAARHEATATRTVTVSDTKAPVIASDTTAKDLAENSGPGQAVYTIAANDAGGVTDYAIGGTDDSHLSVNSTTGVVTLTANPDYETKPSYSFTVTASDAAGNTSVAKEVTFSITDVDEIAPTITSEATATNLAENSGAGQTVYTITATDDVAVTSYAIAGTDASYLSVNSSTGVVTLTANPDYEAKPSYSFTVTARDGAGNTSVAKEVTFSITDVDEDAPMITLKGNASIALAVGDSFTDPGYSAIDAVDGNLTSRIVVTGTVDSNKAGTYTLTYNVSDTGGNKAEPVTRTVTVLATKAPVIILKGNASIALAVGDSFTDPGYSAIDAVDGNLTSRIVVTGTVDSNKAGTYTLTYNVSDTGGNKAEPVTRTVTVLATKAPVIILKGNASIALAVGDSFTDPGYSAIDAVDGNLTSRIVVTGTVDSNKAGTYTLTYNVSDTGGNKAEPVTRTVTVLATKAPMITLKGNASIALAVGDSFTDPGYSAIDAVDGNLTSRIVVTGTVNSNKAGTYTLTYNVSDTGGNKAEPVTRTVTVLATKAPVIILKGNASIALAVGDSFTDPGYSAIDVVDGNLTSSIVVTGTVDSNKAGTYTLTYNVSDTGGNKAEPVTRTVTVLATKAPMITLKGNASIALAVGDSFTDPGYSAIDAVDGNLTSSIVVTGTVDSNKAGIYTLTYNVSDTGGNKAAPVTRTVTVLDIKAPVITSGTTATNLAENSGAGQTVYTITATDDVGVTSYAIGGTDATSLALTGAVVTLKANPNYETKSSYSFTVIASDAAGNTSEAKTVTFSITDVDEIAPTITSEAIATNLAENSGAGQTVYTITATDDVAVTSYAIAGTDASYLSVNSSTGVVTLTADPDYETKPSYNFTVTASDSANTSAATMVTFSITNIEDQTPVITSGTTAPNLAENSGAGQTVYTITATDDVAVTSYAIGGTDASYLSVNSSTGVVTLTADPDYETKPSYSFTVTASDSANTSAATTVTFSITNIEDQAPVITSGTTATNLAENSGAGQTVYTITATDDVAVTSYAIAGTDASYLSVNGSTGVVTLTADPDYETKPSYSFTVTASDSANTSAATTVTFSITNIEDQTPVITSGTTATNLAENSGAGQTVYTITATDDVAVTRYAIAGTDASYLSVNSSTGVVTLTADPDYETKPSYSFTVTASDSANTSAATTVTFSITDVDEVAPVITLKGNASIALEVGDSFTDPGATAQDAVDGDLTSSIVVTGTVDLNTVGTYTLTYNVSDGAGNAAVEVVRTVIVEPVSIRLIIPEDIVVTASGYLTAVNLDPDSVASGADGDGNPLLVSVDQTGPFVSGTHQIVWSVSDGNRRVSATQILKVVPLVTTAVATYADEGVSISIAFLLSGEAADYPVTVPFSLSGTAVEGEDYSIDVSDQGHHR